VVGEAAPAAADNCGSISDCLPTGRSILAALAALLILAGIAAAVAGTGGLAAAGLAALFESSGLALVEGGVLASAGAISAAAAAELAAAGVTATGVGIVLAEAADAGGSSGGGSSGARPDLSLGRDPATGSFRQSEYDTAVRVQEERGVTLRRSHDPSVDWVDEAGNTYDAVGNFPSRYFDQQWRNLQTRILDHMAKADYEPVDVSQFTPEQVALVRTFVQDLGPRVFLVGG
jgi:hypothetical protein